MLGACANSGGAQPRQAGGTDTTDAIQFGHGAGKGATTAAAGHIGQSLDAADQAAMSRTMQTALEGNQPNQPLPWQGQHGSGTVTPGAYYQAPSGQYCREFQQTINVGGETQQGYGKACRQPDGSWRIVNN